MHSARKKTVGKGRASAAILQVLAVLVSTESIFGAINWLFISQGRGAQLLRYGVFDALTRIVAVGIGMLWGPFGIAVALALAATFVHLPAQIWYACRQGPVRQAEVYRMLAGEAGTHRAFSRLEVLRGHINWIESPAAASRQLAERSAVMAMVSVTSLKTRPRPIGPMAVSVLLSVMLILNTFPVDLVRA